MRGLPVVDEFGRTATDRAVERDAKDHVLGYGVRGESKPFSQPGVLHSTLDEVMSVVGDLAAVNMRLHRVADALIGPVPEDSDDVRDGATIWDGMCVSARLEHVQRSVLRLYEDMEAAASRLERAVGK